MIATAVAVAPGEPARPTLHDTKLALDCRPEQAADGTTRCLPPSPSIGQTGDAPAPFVAFADPGCTQPIVVAPADKPKFARRPQSPAGGACAPDVYAVGAEMTGTAAIYGSFTGMDGQNGVTAWQCSSCVDISTVLSGSNKPAIYAATVVPPSDLCPMAIEVR